MLINMSKAKHSSMGESGRKTLLHVVELSSWWHLSSWLFRFVLVARAKRGEATAPRTTGRQHHPNLAPGRPLRVATTSRNTSQMVSLGHRISEKIELIGLGVLGPVALMDDRAVRLFHAKAGQCIGRRTSPTRHLQRHRTYTDDNDEDAGRDERTWVCTHRPTTGIVHNDRFCHESQPARGGWWSSSSSMSL
jgi:hypothetical protein